MFSMTGIEREIRHILKSENSAVMLSEKLFGRRGLFGRLASSEPDREKVVRSPLFRQALARFTKLKKGEATELTQAIQNARAARLKHPAISQKATKPQAASGTPRK